MGTLNRNSGESENAFPSLPKNTPQDEWHIVVEKSQTKNPFLVGPGSADNNLIIKDYTEQTVIKKGTPWFFGLILLGFGLFMFSGPLVLMWKEQALDIFLTLGFIGLSFIFLVPAYISLTFANKIMLKRLDNSIILKYGYYPFVKELSYPHNEFEIHLYQCSIEEANKVKKPGQIVLSLIGKKQGYSELILAIFDTEAKAISAFEKLKSFIGQSSQYDLSDSIELADGEYLNVCKTSLSGNYTEGKKRKYCIVSDKKVAFKSDWFHVALYASAFIIGLWLTFSPDDVPDNSMFDRVLFTILKYGVVGFMILGGIIGFLIHFSTRCIIAEKEIDSLHYSPFARKNIKAEKITNLSDIISIQICTVCESKLSRISYEINAITCRTDGKRIGITCSDDYDQISIDANAFAEFLGVPLIEHTTK